MTAKRVCLFFLLLLSSSTSFSFPNEALRDGEQETLGAYYEFEEEATDLYKELFR